MSATKQQKHEAGRHLAAARALLRGYSARLVGPRTYIEVNGRPAAVQVAAKGAWIIQDVNRFLGATTERIVLVDISSDPPELYIVPGDDLRAIIRRQHDAFRARWEGKRPRNPDSPHAAINPEDVQRWKDRWSLFE